MLCAALSASARPALLRPRGAAQPATTHRTACVPAAAAAGRASRCAAPLAADIHILRSYSSRRTSVRVAASAEEPAASSPSSPDVRSSEQQQALPPAPTPSSPLPPAAADPHAARLPPPASAAAVTAALSSVVGGVVDARLAGVRGQLVQEVVATLTSEPRLLLKELLLVIGEHAPASGGTDTAELRRRVTDLLEARMEELGAAKGQQQQRGGEGAAKQGSGSSGPGGEPTETGGGGGGGGGGSGGGGVGGGGGRRRAGGGGGGSGGAGGSGSAPNLAVAVGAVAMILACCVAWALEDGQQLYQREREPPAGAEETAAAVGVRAVGSTPGPYPGIRLPHTSPIPGQVVTLDNVCVGLVVRRGPDWDKIYTNFMEAGVDGGPGNDGVVTNVSKTGRYASVRWNATGETSYSCNITGMPGYHELVVAPAEAQRRKWPWEWVWRKQ